MAEERNYIRLISGTGSGEYQQPAMGSGGGGSSDMEVRVAKLESDVGHIAADVRDLRDTSRDLSKSLGDVRERLSKVEAKIDHLPSKDFVVKVFFGGFAIFTALSGFITLFQGELRHVFRSH